MTIYMAIATVSYLGMVLGFAFRKQRKRHVPLMHFAIITDLTLVLVLEFQRSAIKTAVGLTLDWMQQTHVTVSTLAAVCYIPMLWMGWAILRGKSGPNTARRHKILGWVTFALRTLGFVFMFSMIERVQNL